MIRKQFLVSGRVQGVGFRYRAALHAKKLGVTGFVQNLYDGRVQMQVQGSSETVDALIHLMKQERWIKIDHLESLDIPTIENESQFKIKY